MTRSSSETQEQTTSGLLASFILIGTFAIILAILMTNTRPEQQGQIVPEANEVVIVATETPPPTATTEPPTATSAPTNTPVPTAVPSPTAIPASPTAIAASADTSSASNVDYDPAVIARGQELFVLCSACHGPDGRGLPNLGKDLVMSEFVNSLTDQELADFVKVGRPIWDPANTSGIDMPPKGGNPAMTDEELMAIIAYIRSLSS